MYLLNKKTNNKITFNELFELVKYNQSLKIGSSADILLLFINMYKGEIRFFSDTIDMDNIDFILKLYGADISNISYYTKLSNNEFSDVLDNLIVDKQISIHTLDNLNIIGYVYFSCIYDIDNFLKAIPSISSLLDYE